MQIFGHRGAAGLVLENTILSFKKALEMGVYGIELDIQLSADNQLIVFHDNTLDRLINQKGYISSFTSEKLKQLQISTLAEVLEIIDKKCVVNIEIKNTRATELVIETIEDFILNKHWNYNQFIVSSFYWEALQEVKFLNSKIKIGVLTEKSVEKAIAFANEIQAFSINPYFKLLNVKNVQEIKENNFEIHAWTVNQPNDIAFMKQLNCNAIITDFPYKI